MIIQISGGKGGQRLTVQAVRRGSSGFDDVAFVEFELYFSGYIFLGAGHKSLYGFPKGREPFSFVNDLSHLVAQVFFGLHGGAVKDQLF